MLNKRPIFIIGFARGGTNIILNLLRSHPDVCSPRGETDQVFRGKGRFPLIKEPLARERALFMIHLEVFVHFLRKISKKSTDTVTNSGAGEQKI